MPPFLVLATEIFTAVVYGQLELLKILLKTRQDKNPVTKLPTGAYI